MPPSVSTSRLRLYGVLALGVLLANVGDGETCICHVSCGSLQQANVVGYEFRGVWDVRTRWQTLLELLGLVGVLEDEGVDVL
jgi:hypothetical protein